MYLFICFSLSHFLFIYIYRFIYWLIQRYHMYHFYFFFLSICMFHNLVSKYSPIFQDSPIMYPKPYMCVCGFVRGCVCVCVGQDDFKRCPFLIQPMANKIVRMLFQKLSFFCRLYFFSALSKNQRSIIYICFAYLKKTPRDVDGKIRETFRAEKYQREMKSRFLMRFI